MRNAVHAFNRAGPAALTRHSSRPQTPQAAFTPEQVRALLHRSPRDFGLDTSLRMLELAAAEADKAGLTPHRVTDETIRATCQEREILKTLRHSSRRRRREL